MAEVVAVGIVIVFALLLGLVSVTGSRARRKQIEAEEKPAELVPATIAEVVDSVPFAGHVSLTLELNRGGEEVQACGVISESRASDLYAGVEVLIEADDDFVGYVRFPHDQWDGAAFGARIAAHLEEPTVETRQREVIVEGRVRGKAVSINLDDEGWLTLAAECDVPLGEDATVELRALSDLFPLEEYEGEVAPGIGGYVWELDADDVPVGEEIAKRIRPHADGIREWLEVTGAELSIFDGQADTYVQLLLSEPPVVIDLLERFVELVAFDEPAIESDADRSASDQASEHAEPDKADWW